MKVLRCTCFDFRRAHVNEAGDLCVAVHHSEGTGGLSFGIPLIYFDTLRPDLSYTNQVQYPFNRFASGTYLRLTYENDSTVNTSKWKPTHMVKEALYNDFMSRSSSLHQRSEARPWLSAGEKHVITHLMIEQWDIDGCGCINLTDDTHLTLTLALLSNRNLTICWWPVLVQWYRAVQPRESFSSNSAPCFWEIKQLRNCFIVYNKTTTTHYTKIKPKLKFIYGENLNNC